MRKVPNTYRAGSAANNGANDNNKIPFSRLSRMWQTSHGDDLKLRHFTGAWLNKQHGPPTTRQAYGERTLQRYINKLGVAESDLSRMRWFAFSFKSVSELKDKEPTATTWTKVKEIIARRRHPQAAPAAKPTSNDMKLVVAERPVDQMIGAMRTLQSHAAQVGKLTKDSDEWKKARAAFEELVKVVEVSLGGHITFADAAVPGQALASLATDLAAQTRTHEFESTSGELPAARSNPADDIQFKPLLQR